MPPSTRIAPTHPGEVLSLFLTDYGLTQNGLATAIGVSPRRINEIVHGKRGISADTALRLSRFFGNTPQFWQNLQARYELESESDRLGEQLARIVPIEAAS